MSVSYTHPLCSGTAQPEQKCLREGGSSDPGVNANASSKLEADLMDQLSFFESKGFFITLQGNAGVMRCTKAQLHVLFLGRHKHCFTHA